MFCQKCRTPLALDPSIGDLKSAAYDLLVATSSQEASSNSTLPSQPSYPQDEQRRNLLQSVAESAPGPIFRRQGGPDRHDHSRDAAMSFIQLADHHYALPIPKSPSTTRRRSNSRTTSSWPSSAQQNQAISNEYTEASKVHDMERVNKLFEILSARSDIDHPICVECTDLLVEELQKKLETATKERDTYIAFIKQVQDEEPTEAELKAQIEELESQKAAEAAITAELLELEKEKAQLDAELLDLEKESQEMDAQEEAFWMDRNEFADKLAGFQNERDSVNSMFDHDSRLLEKLQRSNVYNDTFCISHDGTFATINGLRLGRLSNKPVGWSEINAAWGHALLLLDTVARQLQYRFVGYELQPMGNTSRIIKLDISAPSSSRQAASSLSRSGSRRAAGSSIPSGNAGAGSTAEPDNLAGSNSLGSPHDHAAPVKRTTLDLFSSGDMPLGLTFMHRRFDTAMVAFLELVRQLGDFVRRESTQLGRPLELPYKIEGDHIGNISIKLGIAHDDTWTNAYIRAMKFSVF
ncbi:Vacuolar protein sorting-associated protein atg6 [Ceratocystis fimbriata CBS 114723]|uniref:Vacuolar protein sorting-associated protein atg6 n=1 Tax=Ceratocystis fimbriata CBS 114723 TaxID=1035309 RepID=A0A2C5X0P1_9PEZI|nr:Vacuolar protein sorting-associated protein atg6 [Ceratocystis fimbriata CBS 114723]